MKHIGFIDYRINEWHANNYPAWIRSANQTLGTDYAVSYAWAEVAPEETDAWCKTYGAVRCDSIGELCEKSDVILLLAPSNPEKHLDYAKIVLPYKKITYIDKTFAPDAATAEAIYALADTYGTPIFSTSALRYATELTPLSDDTALITWGGGSNLPEYIIHQIEMAVTVFKSAPLRVRMEQQGAQYVCRAEFDGGKQATFIYADPLPFAVLGKAYAEIKSDMFGALITDILRFYETGTPGFDRRETLWAMRLRERVIEAMQKQNIWLEV